MYGLAYVLLPAEYTSLQAELDRSLARFQRGDETELPAELLAFHDETDELAKMHLSRIWFDNGTIRAGVGHPEDIDVLFHLDYGKLNEHFTACQLTKFEGSFLELEPDFDAFVGRFAKSHMLDPKRQRYGRLLNPLARWDWWELGGRFNGVITGEAQPAGPTQHISSGESIGRDVLGNIVHALGGPSNTHNAEIELNVELIETLRGARLAGEATRFPSAIVLPLGVCANEGRWIDEPTWRGVPPSAREFLAVDPSADFGAILGRVYNRFRTHVAAGVAYHF